MRVFAALYLSAFSLAVFAQTTSNQVLTSSYDLIEQGLPDRAVTALTNLAGSPTATAADRGRAETLLGVGLEEQGQFRASGQAFESALRLLDIAGHPTSEFAFALDEDAGLELVKGNFDLSRKLLDQAAAIATQLGFHTQLSSILLHLAGLEIHQQHYHEARDLLQKARAEFHLAGDSARAIAPEVYGTSAWLSVLTHKPHQAVTDYAAALNACTHLYGERHMLTGWAHMLLGRAQAADHDLPSGLASMQTGLAILKETIGTNSQRYLISELAYSSLLDDAGSHAEASRISSAANKTLLSLRSECPGCTTSIWELQHH
jgi:tetratricopeptide (TPR) repeat protein